MTDTPQWNDEPVDARLRDLAKEYHRPTGEVPREAMWQAIVPAVRAAGAPAVAPVATPDIAPGGVRKRRHIAPYAWSAALAAGLVLGIVLEREVLAPNSAGTVAVTPPADQMPAVAPVSPMPTGGAAAVATPPAAGRQVASASTSRTDARSGAPRAPDHSAPSARATRSDSSATGNAVDAQHLYRLAARQTLVQAEALLTAYRAGDGQQRDQESMQQAGRWARDVLTSTRLLLDSPAAKDPQFRALFTDLELVLAQIVQLSGAPLQAGERELIERAMRDRDLLPRLRSALPAGATAD